MFGIVRGSCPILRPTMAVLTLLFIAIIALLQPTQAQTYKIIHDFAGTASDGAGPQAGVTIDAGGNFYGTAGVIYKLTNKNGNWIFSPLYEFKGGVDGSYPFAKLVIGPDGTFYGTTNDNYGQDCQTLNCFGTVFNLSPPPTVPKTALTPWEETSLYHFHWFPDGAWPEVGPLVFDASGAIYGTTGSGGSHNCIYGCGTVYKLAPSGQGYTESVIYTFTGQADGAFPYGSVAFDQAGNLYTTASSQGTNNGGAIIELTPSTGGWTETTIHEFAPHTDGGAPIGGLILDKSGNLYGTTSAIGPYGGGTVFKLTPSGGSWDFKVLWAFGGGPGNSGPWGNLLLDAAGNLYGTTNNDGFYGVGSAFKLTPSGNRWTYTTLHDFCKDFPTCSDGAQPFSDLVMDADGNLYGTASIGGEYGYGVVFEITP